MSERLRALLVKAVRELEPAEQEEVLGELLVGATAAGATAAGSAPGARVVTPAGRVLSHLAGAVHPAGLPRDRSELMEWSTAAAVAAGDMKLLPVRLPSGDYERLRTWSREHGFSMAVIIRTLVERFLNEQAPVDPPSPVD
jgi:hypothetical protein